MKHPDLYILRHGETVWNQQGKFQGRKDSPLTKTGQSQALKQRELLGSIRDLPDKVFASPQGRAVHTAQLAIGSTDEVILDSRLQEIDFGEWEGATRDEIKSAIDYPFESGIWNFKSPKGESFAMIEERVRSFIQDMQEPAIVVTHGTTSIVLRGLCMGLSQAEILKLPKDQGCIYFLANRTETVIR